MIETKKLFGIRFFGITHIVLGGVSLAIDVLLAAFMLVFGLLAPSAFKEGMRQARPDLPITPVAFFILIFIFVIGLALSIFIIVVGRGLLRLRPWARLAVLIYSGLALLFLVVQPPYTVIHILFFIYEGAAILYFLLPKVKAQFSPGGVPMGGA